MNDFQSYQSPFSWRYASPEMRRIWSEENKRLLWRKLWVWIAQSQAELGLVRPEQVEDLQKHETQINIARSLEIENNIQHDLMAELKAFAEQCPIGGKIIHSGATSMDIKDNAEAIQIIQSLDLLIKRLRILLSIFNEKILEFADITCMAFTHLQPAEPTTVGYRFSIYAQDLLSDWIGLNNVRKSFRGKGFKGAVGTAASYLELIGTENYSIFEKRLEELTGLNFFPATTQTYPRKQEFTTICILAGLGATLSKFSFDIRFLQSPPIGELSEPFSKEQVGSSAMPFKRNPIKAEEITSLSRTLSSMPQIAWHNAASSILERTLDDSANRRILLPEAFLICDEILEKANNIVQGLELNHNAIKRNLTMYLPFSNTEKLMMTLVKAGADRQEVHSKLRQYSLEAWDRIIQGKQGDLCQHITTDSMFLQYLNSDSISLILNDDRYVGIAPKQARIIAKVIQDNIKFE